jgi:Papain family cysteine protease
MTGLTSARSSRSCKYFHAVPASSTARHRFRNTLLTSFFSASLGAPKEGSELKGQPGIPISYAPVPGTWPYEINAVVHDATETTIVNNTSVVKNIKVVDNYSWVAKPPSTACFRQAQKPITLQYSRLSVHDITCWKLCIQAGYPIIFGYRLYPSFMNWASKAETANQKTIPTAPLPGATENIKQTPVSGHAVLAVGWDDSKKCLLVQNSWGDWWGCGGLFWMPYEYVSMNSPMEDSEMIVHDPWTLWGSTQKK